MPKEDPLESLFLPYSPEKQREVEKALERYRDRLAAVLAGELDPDREPEERSTEVDVPNLMRQFRNQEYGPRSSGVPYIFTGGSVFPQTEGQRRAEDLAAGMGAAANWANVINSTISAFRDERNRRKELERLRKQQVGNNPPVTPQNPMPWRR